jgi:hypothetical protein
MKLVQMLLHFRARSRDAQLSKNRHSPTTSGGASFGVNERDGLIDVFIGILSAIVLNS